MKTTIVDRFLALAMVAGLLSASFALPAEDGRAKVRVQAAQNQLVERNKPDIEARTGVAAPAQPASNASRVIALASAADGSARVLEAFPWTDPGNVGRLEGIPDWVWCMVHPRWCWLGDNL